MATKHQWLEPHNVNKTSNIWWYEENDGINLIVESHSGDGKYIKTDSYTIPWDVIRAALTRKDK